MMMTVNPRKTTTVRPLGRVDITRLRAAVLSIPEAVWQQQNSTKPNRFDALDKTVHIPFRFVREFDDWRVSDDLPLWPQWRDLIAPVLTEATAPYGYRRGGYPRIMLARMAPGGVIHPHRDGNPSAKWPHKIHVPLQTNPQVTFEVDGVGHHFAEGDAVEVNNMAVHAVANRGATDRTHLIFEYYDLEQPEPGWINELVGAVEPRV